MKIVLVAGEVHPALSQTIAQVLAWPRTVARSIVFPDGEQKVEVDPCVAGAEVVVVHPMPPPVDSVLMRVALLLDAVRGAGARVVTAVIPYLGYLRQVTRDHPGEPRSLSLVARLLETAGLDQLILVEPHTAAVESIFRVPVVSLSAAPLLAEGIRSWDLERPVVVYPDVGASKRSLAVATALGYPQVLVVKHRQGPRQVAVHQVIGDVQGKDCIIVDDMVSTGGTLVAAVRALRERGARSVHAAFAHALLVNDALGRLEALGLGHLLCTDTLPPPPGGRLEVVSVAPLLVHALRDLHQSSDPLGDPPGDPAPRLRGQAAALPRWPGPVAAPAFRDRLEAGERLADALTDYADRPCLVLAIPRGGLPVAAPVARRLRAPLTPVYTRKLGVPWQPELAFGAMDEDGEIITDATIVTLEGLGREEIDAVADRVRRDLQEREARYGSQEAAHLLPGKVAIIVDDGLATGLTMRAAVAYARRHGAAQVVVAIPCASHEAVARLRRVADEVVALATPEPFLAVGQCYRRFRQVTDEEAMRYLGAGADSRSGTLHFTNPRGLRLVGDLRLPTGPGPYPLVIFSHGFGSSRRSPRNRPLADRLVAEGIGAFLIDFTGHGESEGSLEQSTLERQVEDLQAALELMAGHPGVDPHRLGVHGSSTGGQVALHLAANDHRIQALVLRGGRCETALPLAPLITAATLFIVGSEDPWILEWNRRMAEAMGENARVEVVPGAGHLFEAPGTFERAVALTTKWFQQL